jgi:hypothetical protein
MSTAKAFGAQLAARDQLIHDLVEIILGYEAIIESPVWYSDAEKNAITEARMLTKDVRTS